MEELTKRLEKVGTSENDLDPKFTLDIEYMINTQSDEEVSSNIIELYMYDDDEDSDSDIPRKWLPPLTAHSDPSL